MQQPEWLQMLDKAYTGEAAGVVKSLLVQKWGDQKVGEELMQNLQTKVQAIINDLRVFGEVTPECFRGALNQSLNNTPPGGLPSTSGGSQQSIGLEDIYQVLVELTAATKTQQRTIKSSHSAASTGTLETACSRLKLRLDCNLAMQQFESTRKVEAPKFSRNASTESVMMTAARTALSKAIDDEEVMMLPVAGIDFLNALIHNPAGDIDISGRMGFLFLMRKQVEMVADQNHIRQWGKDEIR